MTEGTGDEGTSFFSSLLRHGRSQSSTASNHVVSDPGSSQEAAQAGSDDNDEDEEGVDVEDLLWAAQMDLIAHRHSSAIAKLRQAVALGSSVACATLGNLLIHGLHAHAPLPTSPGSSSGAPSRSPSYARPNLCRTDSCTASPVSATPEGSLAAAELFILGLEIELGKPVKTQRKMEKMKAGGSPLGELQRSRNDTEDVYDVSDEEGTEGSWFSLERVLDLVVGMTDSFRFGVLYPPQGDALAPRSVPAELWDRGANAATEALGHSYILTPISAGPLASSPEESRRHISLSSNPTLSSSLLSSSTSPGRTITSRSYTHPTSMIPPPLPPITRRGQKIKPTRQHFLEAQNAKLRLTILVHLLYVLAVHSWPTDRSQAQVYWADIVTLGKDAGSIGTKEGDEMIDRARRRLDGANSSWASNQPDGAWQRAKQAKARGKNGQRSMAHSGGVLPDASRADAEVAPQSSPTPELTISAITIRQASPVKNGSESHHPSLPRSASRTPGPKFHFAPEEELSGCDEAHGRNQMLSTGSYPSPPSTPPSFRPYTDSTASDHVPATCLHESAEPGQDKKTGLSLQDQAPIRHVLPSPSARLLGRVKSSASVSTLPSDFTFGHPRTSLQSASTSTIVAATPITSSGTLHRATSLKQSKPSTWTQSWKSGFARFRDTILPSTTENLPPPTPHSSSAMDALQDVLIRDELSAGPGMIWADAIRDPAMESDVDCDSDRDLEGHESQTITSAIWKVTPQSTPHDLQHSPRLEIGVSVRPSETLVPPPPRRLVSSRSQRSFFDPTTAAPRNPRVSRNDSNSGKTAEHQDDSETPGFAAKRLLAASQRGSYSSPNLHQREMDPLLKELERRSRVGVRTVCATCGKKGLNFPTASKGGATFCSRECRIRSTSAGVGIRSMHTGYQVA